MLNLETANQMYADAYGVRFGAKAENSRTLRRFLEQANPGNVFELILANGSGYSPSQLDKMFILANQVNAEFLENYAPDDNASHEVVFRKKDGYLSLAYTWKTQWSDAPLRELQAALLFLVNLASKPVQHWTERLPKALGKCKDYTYRGLPANCAPLGQRWEIGGCDKRSGAGGVLEWCISESDAQAVLEQMQKFPFRFTDLSASISVN